MQSLIYLRVLVTKPHRYIPTLIGKSQFPKRLYSSVTPSRKQMQTSKISFIPPVTPLTEQATVGTAKKSKLKEITKTYGAVGIFVYIGVGCLDLAATLGLIQLAGLEKVKAVEQSVLGVVQQMGVRFGLKEQTAILPPDEELNIKDLVTENGKPSFVSVFVLAYTIHKTVMLPVRIGITAAITPAIVARLHRMGWSRYFPRLLAASAPKKP
jgi:hypothetical protein